MRQLHRQNTIVNARRPQRSGPGHDIPTENRRRLALAWQVTIAFCILVWASCGGDGGKPPSTDVDRNSGAPVGEPSYEQLRDADAGDVLAQLKIDPDDPGVASETHKECQSNGYYCAGSQRDDTDMLVECATGRIVERCGDAHSTRETCGPNGIVCNTLPTVKIWDCRPSQTVDGLDIPSYHWEGPGCYSSKGYESGHHQGWWYRGPGFAAAAPFADGAAEGSTSTTKAPETATGPAGVDGAKVRSDESIYCDAVRDTNPSAAISDCSATVARLVQHGAISAYLLSVCASCIDDAGFTKPFENCPVCFSIFVEGAADSEVR
jgi:hypothetical protein